MSVIVCPAPSPTKLDPNQVVPHPGFGYTFLTRNGRLVWESIDDDWFYEDEPWTVGQLTEWCPVRQGVGWKLVVYGPMVIETYQLRNGEWVLVDREVGFA